jgi:ABC-2 type transport system ATP-binding protein
MSLLEIQDLGARIGRRRVLHQVTLDVQAGQILTVFGKSGAGKSALAAVLAGSLKPTGGSILWEEAVGDDPCSVAFQKPAIASGLSAAEYLDMVGSLLGMSRKARTKRIAQVLELLKLTDHRNRRVERLSWQLQGRLELARAMLPDSPLLVIDGLLDCIDERPMAVLWEHLIGECRGAGKAVMVMTARGRTAELGDKAIALIDGRARYSGDPAGLRRLAGEDVVVVSEAASPQIARQVGEGMAVKVWEEGSGFAFRAVDGELAVGKILADHKQSVGAVFLRRPSLDDGLAALTAEE